MKNLKPFQVIIMAVFGFVALAGIFLFANFKGFNNGVTPLGTVTIWGTLPADAFSSTLATLKQGHQEYMGISYVEKPAATFNEDLAEAIASGQGPDLVIITQEELLETRNKLSVIPSSSISERTFRETYLPIGELFQVQGGTYGIPFVIDPLMLFYNRPVLAAAGAAKPPSTWEAVSGLSAVTQVGGSQAVTRSLIALGTYSNVTNARAILSLLFLQSGSSLTEYTTNGYRSTLGRQAPGTLFEAPPAESALNFYTEFANPGKTVYSWNRSLPDSWDAFVAGDVALYLGFASERAALSAANPNLDFDMAPAPAPGTLTTRITYAHAYAFAIPKSSKNASGAYRAAIGLTSKDALPAIARGLGMAPATRAFLSPAKDDLYQPVYFPEALIAKGWLSPGTTDTDRVFGTMVENVISGRQNVREALNAADQALTQALN